jgi:hypothetical protein
MLGGPLEERLDALNQFVTPSLGAVITVLGVACVVLAVAVIFLLRRTSRLDKRLQSITRGTDGKSLESMLEAHLDKVYSVAREVDELAARSTVLERTQEHAFQRLGLVRFNPFEDTGGNQSFALAMLDQHGDGFIVSSLHARAVTRLYGKAVTAGKAESALSSEEAEALRVALASGTGSSKAG